MAAAPPPEVSVYPNALTGEGDDLASRKVRNGPEVGVQHPSACKRINNDVLSGML